MSDTVILFRTHRDTPFTRDRLAYLSAGSGLAVMPLFDESTQPHGFADTSSVRLNERVFRDLGLEVEPGAAWRCGDYGLYAALDRLPAVKHFWLVEYDVLLSFPRASDFFARYGSAGDIDFLVGGLRRAEPDWYWHHTMATEAASVWRCFFPVTRFSRRAVEHLLAARRALAGRPRAPGERAPNDEAFVATRLVNDGFAVRDLNDFGTVYTKASFRFEWPIRFETVRDDCCGLLLHPVLDAAELAAKPVRADATRMRLPERLENVARRVKADLMLRRDRRRGGAAA